MKLTQEQDATMNTIYSNVQMISVGKDTIVGYILSRSDMQRFANQALLDISMLWEQVGASKPTLGYAPCPFGKNHVVMPISKPDNVACTNCQCPIYNVPINRLDWERRE